MAWPPVLYTVLVRYCTLVKTEEMIGMLLLIRVYVFVVGAYVRFVFLTDLAESVTYNFPRIAVLLRGRCSFFV